MSARDNEGIWLAWVEGECGKGGREGRREGRRNVPLVAPSMRLDKLARGVPWVVTAYKMPLVVLQLIDPDVIHEHGGRQHLAQPRGKAASALWFCAVEAITRTTFGAGLGEAPGGAHSRVEDQVARLLWDLRARRPVDGKRGDVVQFLSVQEPRDVPLRARHPLQAVGVEGVPVLGGQGGEGRDGVSLVDLTDRSTGGLVFLGLVEHRAVEIHVHFGLFPEGKAVVPAPVRLWRRW